MPLNPSGSESGLKTWANEKVTYIEKKAETTIKILKLLMCTSLWSCVAYGKRKSY